MFLFEKLRKNTKIILWITVFAFVGFIFLVWGMDIQKSSGGNPTIIGVVNGQRIPTSYFRERLTQRYEEMRSQTGGRISDTDELRLRQTTWDEVVDEILLQQEVRKRNLQVTEEEVDYYLRYSPPREVIQSPLFQTDGRFDFEKYQQVLADSYYRGKLRTLVRDTAPVRKLQELVFSSAKVSDNEVRAYFEETNQKVDFSFVLVRLSSFAVHPDSAGAEELRAFYDGNPEQFRLKESANLRYILAEKKPSAKDESDAQTLANDIWRDAKAGADFADLAKSYSEGPEAAAGGDINRLAAKGELPPEIAEAAFSLRVGDISAPVRDRSGFNILRLEERKTEGGTEKVRFRRILIPIEPSSETLAATYASLMEAAGRASKASLEEVGREMGFEVRETGLFQEGTVPPIGVQSETVKEFAFKNRVGAVSRPIETQRAWCLLQVAARREAYVPSFEEALPAVKRALMKSRQEQLASQKIDAVASMMSQGASLEQAARASGLSVETATSVRRSDVGFAPGREPAMIGAAFALSEGQTTPVLKGSAGFFILRLDAAPPVDENLFAAQKQQLKMQLVQQRGMMALSIWLEQLRKSAKVKDYRAEALGF